MYPQRFGGLGRFPERYGGLGQFPERYGGLGATPEPYIDSCTGASFDTFEATGPGGTLIIPEVLKGWGGSGINGQTLNLAKLLAGDFVGLGSRIVDGVEYINFAGWQTGNGNPCSWSTSARMILDLLQQMGVAGPNGENLGVQTVGGYEIIDADTGERRAATEQDILPPPPPELLEVVELPAETPEDIYQGQQEAYDEWGAPEPGAPEQGAAGPPVASPPVYVPPPVTYTPEPVRPIETIGGELEPQPLEAGIHLSPVGWLAVGGLLFAVLRGKRPRR